VGEQLNCDRHSLGILLGKPDCEEDFLTALERQITCAGWTRAHDIEATAAPILREQFFCRSFRRPEKGGICSAVVSLGLAGPEFFLVSIRDDDSASANEFPVAQQNRILQELISALSFLFLDFDWAFALKTTEGDRLHTRGNAGCL
jgi:hypothetical protein